VSVTQYAATMRTASVALASRAVAVALGAPSVAVATAGSHSAP